MIVLDNNEKDIVIPDYNDLDNKPSINGVVLEGNKTAAELGIDIDTTNFYTKGQADGRFQLKGNYLTSIPAEYITETELNRKDFATNSDVNDEIGKLDSALSGEISKKQNALVSGENIKTINGISLLGDGNIEISGGESVAYLIIKENSSENTYSYVGGSFEDVVNAYNNNKPYFIYVPNGADVGYYSLAETTIITDTYIQCLSFAHTGVTHTWRYWRLYSTSAQLYSQTTYEYATTTQLNSKQNTLVSGTNIKTINGNSIIGGGNIQIETDLSDYYTKGEVNEAINDISTNLADNYYTILEVDELIESAEPDLAGYATETWVGNHYQPKGSYLTSVPSEYVTDTELTNKGYVTQQWIEEQGYLTSIPSEYVTESELDIKLDEIDTKAPYIIVDYENEIWEGDFQGVIDAMKNGEEYFIYATIDTHIHLATQNVVGTDRLSIYWFRVSSNRTQRVGIVFDYNGNFISKTTTYANIPVDNLTSTSTGLPLSANQGKVLKGLIDSNSTEITNLTNTIGDINTILENIIG